jgi:peptidoglycan hydrolase-like protein with peptidoglycan-binding domain
MRKLLIAFLMSLVATPLGAGAFQLSSPGVAVVLSSFDSDPGGGIDVSSEPRTKPARCTVLTRTMWLGAVDDRNGGEVTLLQAFLKREGFYKGDTTGRFNKKTEDALRAWQEEHAIEPESSQFFTTTLNEETINKIRELSCNFKPGGASGTSFTPESCALVWDEFGNRVPECGDVKDSAIEGTYREANKKDLRVKPADLKMPDKPRAYRIRGDVPKSCVTLTRVFWKGATNRTTNGDVSRLQKYLESQYGITDGNYDPRGYFGEATEAMLLEWQKDNGVKSKEFNGHETYVDDETISAIRKATCESRNDAGYTTCTAITGKDGELKRGRCTGHQVYIKEGQKCPKNAYCVIRGQEGVVSAVPVGKVVSPNGGETLMIETDVKVSWELDRMGEVRVIAKNMKTGDRRQIISGYTSEGTDVPWHISPAFEPGEYKLLLQLNGAVLDESDGVFELVPWKE